MPRRSIGLLAAAFVCAQLRAQGFQEPVPETAPTARTAQDPERARMQEIERLLRELDEKYKDEIEDLRFELQTLQEAAARHEAAAREQPQLQNVFNPRITVFGNFLARSDDQHVFVDDDPALERLDDRMNLREVELDFRAAIDPWADGVLIGTFGQEVPGEFETEVEEGYFLLKKLPVLDSAPGGLKLKVGRFRPDFGRFNKIHLHDLPQIDYPRSLQTFLGEEGYIQNGASGQFFLPQPSETSTLEATLSVLNGGDMPLADGQEGSELALLGHLAWFGEVSSSTSLELGASAWKEGSDRQLYGVDATYKWKPLVGGEWRSFLIGGELYRAELDDTGLDESPMGFYVWSQYQLDRNTYLGVRFDRSEEVDDSSLQTDTYGAYLTYYTTEFLRFRLAAEHAESDLDVVDGRNSAFLELNFVFGSHPVEPYWVNR
jgi:hypothetical protein